ncbi:MAG: mercury(II) reductase [Acidiferrobacteraceae bacterium]
MTAGSAGKAVSCARLTLDHGTGSTLRNRGIADRGWQRPRQRDVWHTGSSRATMNANSLSFERKDSSRLRIALIGAGSASAACALRLVEEGARVTIIESGTLGGTCVNTGCIPSKAMVRAAGIAHLMRHHGVSGIRPCDPDLNQALRVDQQRALVDDLRRAKYDHLLTGRPDIALLHGRARFADPHTLTVTQPDGEDVVVGADRILIATGASPWIPSIPGLSETPYWTSTEALFARTVPQHLAVLGGSAVALELAQAFRRLGARVTLIARSTLLSREDPALGAGIGTIFEGEGIDVRLHTVPERIDYRSGRFELSIHGKSLDADALLVATGRRPNTEGLGLGTAGVVTDSNGAIVVDTHLRTSAGHIYAAGDCANQPPLVYVAAAAGTRAAVNMLGGDRALDLFALPAVVFTDPQIATVGLTERQALRHGLVPEVRTLALEAVPRAQVNFDTRGFIKLVADKISGRLLGVQILAPEGGEIIAAASLAIRHRVTVSELGDQLFPYLTMAESLKLAAQAFTRDVTQLSCCAG